MNRYEALLDEANDKGLIVKEKSLQSSNGRIKGNRIAIRKDLKTTAEKACVLAEELGHYETTVGDILDFLNVTEEYLLECIECYRDKYGEMKSVDNYMVYFIPNLAVIKII